jgi:PAS domain S-box-containing protein
MEVSGMIARKKNKTPTVSTPTGAILESISDGVFTVDLAWRITSFNRAAEEITGAARSDAIGRRCSEVFGSSMCGADCALQQTLKTGRPIIGKSGYIIDADGNRIPISVSTAVLRDAGCCRSGLMNRWERPVPRPRMFGLLSPPTRT